MKFDVARATLRIRTARIEKPVMVGLRITPKK